MTTTAYALPRNPRWTDEARSIVTMRPGAPQGESLRRLAWTVLRADKAARAPQPRHPAPGAAA